MARGKITVSEDKLKTLLGNWLNNDIDGLAKMLGVDTKTINSWAVRLRKAMKESGLSDDQIKAILPPKRVSQHNVFKSVVRSLYVDKPTLEKVKKARKKLTK